MRGVVHLINEDEGLRVPLVSLINERNGQAMVFVAEDGVARMKKVSMGVRGGSYAVISGEVAEGDRVVVVGQAALSDGDDLRVGDEYE